MVKDAQHTAHTHTYIHIIYIPINFDSIESIIRFVMYQ